MNTAPTPLTHAVVLGASAGGTAALEQILPALPAAYPLPLLIVQHLHPHQLGPALLYRRIRCALHLKEAEDKEPVQAGTVYFAPPNYHLLVESDGTLALSIDARVHHVRPSVDVLFESAADVYGPGLIGVILSGANDDGAHGLAYIKAHGGRALVQDPATAEVPTMPRAALAATAVDGILAPHALGAQLAAWGVAEEHAR